MQFTSFMTARHGLPLGNVGQNRQVRENRYRQAHFAILAVALAILAIALETPAFESGTQPAKQPVTEIAIASSPCLVAGQYYVATSGSDSNEGSSCKPWATIQHAAAVAGPGSTVHVNSGTYSAGTITTNASGTANARITYVSDEKWGAKLQGVGANIVWANHGDFVDIEGFEVTGDGVATIGLLNYASNVRYLGNNVHAIPATGCPENGAPASTTMAPMRKIPMSSVIGFMTSGTARSRAPVCMGSTRRLAEVIFGTTWFFETRAGEFIFTDTLRTLWSRITRYSAMDMEASLLLADPQ